MRRIVLYPVPEEIQPIAVAAEPAGIYRSLDVGNRRDKH
jgi:hypothetical protein